jgi:hypothetical protein
VADIVAAGFGVGAGRDQDGRRAARRVDRILDVLVAAVGAELVDQEVGGAVDDDLLDPGELIGFAAVGDDPMAALDRQMIAGVVAGRRVGAGGADDGVVAGEAGEHVVAGAAVQLVVARGPGKGQSR